MTESRRDRAKAAVEKIRAAEKMSRTASSGSERVDAAIKKIRAFFELGRNLPREQQHKEKYRKKIIDNEADLLNINPDIVRKARAFADPKDGYTRGDLAELCRLIRKEQPIIRVVKGKRKELPIFERTHLIRLLSVRPKKRRQTLQKQCIEQGWSTAQLEREIAKRYGTRREGGRRRAIPADLTGLLAQLEGMCEEWRRWKEELSRDPEELSEKHVLLDDVPDTLRKEVEAVSKTIWALHQEVVEELKRLQPDREVRGALQTGADDGKRPAGRRRRNR